MGKSQVCSTEDAVHALLDYLVEPLLPPAESTKQRTPSESRQLSVAKQVLFFSVLTKELSLLSLYMLPF
ncbi:hypothetical protein SLA2020_411580 [Shorea laevis]